MNDPTIPDLLMAREPQSASDEFPPLNRKDRRARAARTRVRSQRTCACCASTSSVSASENSLGKIASPPD